MKIILSSVLFCLFVFASTSQVLAEEIIYLVSKKRIEINYHNVKDYFGLSKQSRYYTLSFISTSP